MTDPRTGRLVRGPGLPVRGRAPFRVRLMFAVTAARIDADNPLNGLELGERPEPTVDEGWTTVTVRGHRAQPPRRLDASRRRDPGGAAADHRRLRRRRDRRGRERGDRALGDRRPRPRRWRRDPGPQAVAAVGGPRRHLRRAGRGAAAQPGAQARLAVVRGGGLPAHGVADRVPDAVRQVRRAARVDHPRAGRGRWSGDRAHRAGCRRRIPRVGDQPRRGQAQARAGARRRPGLRVRRAAARAGRRRHGDRRSRRRGATR